MVQDVTKRVRVPVSEQYVIFCELKLNKFHDFNVFCQEAVSEKLRQISIQQLKEGGSQ